MHVRSKTTFTNCQCIQKSSFLEMIIGNSPEVFLLKLLPDRDPEPEKTRSEHRASSAIKITQYKDHSDSTLFSFPNSCVQ